MIHEFEEYTWPGGFKRFVNTGTILAPDENTRDVPLNESYILFINPILIWTWAVIGAVFYTTPWIGFGLILFQFGINNIGHTVLFQIKQKGYNPGLLTTLAVLIPYCTLVIWYVIDQHILTTTAWILSFVLAFGVLAILQVITFSLVRHAGSGQVVSPVDRT
jgi:hypothetical protein